MGNGGNVYAINAQLKIKTDTMAGPQRNKIQKGQSPQSLQFIRAQWREGEEGSVECGEGEGMREGKAVERLNGQHMQVRSHSVIKTNVKSGQTHRGRQRKGPTGPEAVLLGSTGRGWGPERGCV